METHKPSLLDDREKLQDWLSEVHSRMCALTEHFFGQPLSSSPAPASTSASPALAEAAPPQASDASPTPPDLPSGGIAEKLQQQTELIEKLQQQVDKIESSIQDFTYKDEINSRLHKELQKYKDGLSKEFVTPLLKGIVGEYDRAARQHKVYAQKANQGGEYANLLKQFETMMDALLVLLYDYDVEPYDVKEGDEYSPKTHRILEVIDTTDAQKDGKIAACITCGFRDTSNERVMRHAEVNVYKVKQV